MTQICLIDAKNFLFRNHYTHRDLKGPNDEPTSVLYGCLNGMLSLHKRLQDVPIIMVWDGGGETWRHRFLSDQKPEYQTYTMDSKDIIMKPRSPGVTTDWVEKQFANSINFLRQGIGAKAGVNSQSAYGRATKPVGYKAHRVDASGAQDKTDALLQIPELKKTLRSLGLRNFKIYGLEGDDLIGIMATAIIKRKLFNQVIIHSSDTDFYQLLSDDIKILKRIDINGQLEWIEPRDVLGQYHVNVKDWIKYRAITGDVSDNIPKLLNKVGPVRAVQLLRAGVDASKGRHEASQQAINALNDMTKGTLNIDDFWVRLRKNYIACQIMTCDGYVVPMNDEEVTTKIIQLTESLDSEMLLRDTQGKSEEAYRNFCEWCMSHGMADLRRKASDFAGFV